MDFKESSSEWCVGFCFWVRNLCMGTVVEEQAYKWEKILVKWDSSRLTRDGSKEQALFWMCWRRNWHIGLRKLRFMYECGRNRKSRGTVTGRRQTIFRHNTTIAVNPSSLADRRRWRDRIWNGIKFCRADHWAKNQFQPHFICVNIRYSHLTCLPKRRVDWLCAKQIFWDLGIFVTRSLVRRHCACMFCVCSVCGD